MDSLDTFFRAVQTFMDRLEEVDWRPLLIALGFHLLNLALRTRAWRNIIAAAYPQARVRWAPVFGAYCAGVGINSILPARGGDAVKLFLVHARVPQSSYPTLAATLVAETLFDLVMASVLLAWAFQLGVFPDLPDLPNLPTFEFGWLVDHPIAAALIGCAIVTLVVATSMILARRVRAFWARVRQGLVILRTPGRFIRTVVTYQAAGWGCRVGSAYFFLEAFHIPATFRNALLVLVIQAVATALPLTPGGLGPKQGLLLVVFTGLAPRSSILAYSVGQELAITAFNLVLGLACLGIMLRGFSFRRAMREAKAQRAEATVGAYPIDRRGPP